MSEPTKLGVQYFPERSLWRSGIGKRQGLGEMLCSFSFLANEKDGELWADATNVYAKNGLTPSQLAEQRAELLAEMNRYLPILETIEGNPELWERITARHGIATLNGYRNAIAKAIGQ